MNKKTSPVVLITGAASGFGRDAAVSFAKNGFVVIAAVRRLSRANELLAEMKQKQLKEQMILVEFDVTNHQQVKEAIESVMIEVGSIDVLINNAGFAFAGFAEDLTISEWRTQFETNLFGVIAVTNEILPWMREQGYGRIINMSSISGKVSYPGIAAYGSSKHALEGYSESLRLEVMPFGIDVCLLEPGSYKTKIWSSGKRVASASASPSSPYYSLFERLERAVERRKDNFGDREEVIRTLVRVATAKRPKLRYPVGKGVKITILAKTILPWRLWEKLVHYVLKKIE
ncbi:SDR family oxidoreductase [Desertibacillus haloalkaliphilus]|uniref:SDR family oxidoreductase n=1 Tax=Desertibacillus haloalkaliphilus TaxID=1328930 RepID=UPI001C25E5AC|nr:SDR family oxidoreductase [Desertibacillus haloalkaliphilus]MBU8906781.1 SDR family oxidoreductase [Desertibacillus haloalkaliphilus]